MYANSVPLWVPQYLLPFFSLSYPTDPPPKTDSFHNSQHYGTGWLDLCTIVGLIATMAILRDLARVCVFEPFACWKLSKDLRAKKAGRNSCSSSPMLEAKLVSNGVGNGHQANGNARGVTLTAAEKRKIHRSVLRFAEQGWALLCYSFQCGFGFVSPVFLLGAHTDSIRFGSMFTTTSQRKCYPQGRASGPDIPTTRYLDLSNSTTLTRPRSTSMGYSF